MKIGFDAKRIFFNKRGLGNYSRSLIENLTSIYNKNQYFLYTPNIPEKQKQQSLLNLCHLRTPNLRLAKQFSSLWRSFGVCQQIKKDCLDVYHGLSHELPFGIPKNIKKIVTIHDLLPWVYPNDFSLIDKVIYKKKIVSSCSIADHIVVTSENTKADLLTFVKVDYKKVSVVYQSCDKKYSVSLSKMERQKTLDKYAISSSFILCVSSLEERKNLLILIRAMVNIKKDIKLVIVGRGSKKYKSKILLLANKLNISSQISILENVATADLAAIYQSATIFCFPSFYEGFGIPILEAMSSRVPVVLSSASCFREIAGEAGLYFAVNDAQQLSNQLLELIENNRLKEKMLMHGEDRIKEFSNDKTTKKILQIYKS